MDSQTQHALLTRLLHSARIFLIGAIASLYGCASGAEKDSPPAELAGARPSGEPELILTLPPEDTCLCEEQSTRQLTYLEQGFKALAQKDHMGALGYFQRYQNIESSREANWEAAIAIAYDSMLADSPFYDPRAAASSYRKLKTEEVDESRVHGNVLMMRDALAAFSALQIELTKLRGENAVLAEDLAKREEALKRLRELTLGQKGAAQ